MAVSSGPAARSNDAAAAPSRQRWLSFASPPCAHLIIRRTTPPALQRARHAYLTMRDADSHLMEIPAGSSAMPIQHPGSIVAARLEQAGTPPTTYRRAVEREGPRPARDCRERHRRLGDGKRQIFTPPSAPGLDDPAAPARLLHVRSRPVLAHDDLTWYARVARTIRHREFCRERPRLIAVGQLSLQDPMSRRGDPAGKAGCGAFWILRCRRRGASHPDIDPCGMPGRPHAVHGARRPNTQPCRRRTLNNGQLLPPDIVGGEEPCVRDFAFLVRASAVPDGPGLRRRFTLSRSARRRHRARSGLGSTVSANADVSQRSSSAPTATALTMRRTTSGARSASPFERRLGA